MEHHTTFDTHLTRLGEPQRRASDAETMLGLVMAVALSVGTALLVLSFL